MINNLSTLLSFQISPIWGIKNEGLKVVKTPLNPSLSFLKKLPNKVIALLPSFFKHPNKVLVIKLFDYIFIIINNHFL